MYKTDNKTFQIDEKHRGLKCNKETIKKVYKKELNAQTTKEIGGGEGASGASE